MKKIQDWKDEQSLTVEEKAFAAGVWVGTHAGQICGGFASCEKCRIAIEEVKKYLELEMLPERMDEFAGAIMLWHRHVPNSEGQED